MLIFLKREVLPLPLDIFPELHKTQFVNFFY